MKKSLCCCFNLQTRIESFAKNNFATNKNEKKIFF